MPQFEDLPNLGGTARVYGIAPVPLFGVSAGTLPGGGREDAGAPVWWIQPSSQAPQPDGLFTKPTRRQLGAGRALAGLAGCVPGMGALDDAVSDAMAFQQATIDYFNTPMGPSSSQGYAAQAAQSFMDATNPSANIVFDQFGIASSVSPDFAMWSSVPSGDPAPRTSSVWDSGADALAALPPATAPVQEPVANPGASVDTRFTTADGTKVVVYSDGTWASAGPSGTTSLRYASNPTEALAQARREVGLVSAPSPSGGSMSSSVPGSTPAPVQQTAQQGPLRAPPPGWTADHRDGQGVWVDSRGYRFDGTLGAQQVDSGSWTQAIGPAAQALAQAGGVVGGVILTKERELEQRKQARIQSYETAKRQAAARVPAGGKPGFFGSLFEGVGPGTIIGGVVLGGLGAALLVGSRSEKA